MLSCVKFFANMDELKRETIPLLSRTLRKIAVISKDYKGTYPKDGEWWWVRIVQETFAKGSSSSLSGVFVLEPIKIVERRILRLIPGMFTHRLEEDVLIIRPNQNLELPWTLPLQLRKNLELKYKASSVIVDLSPNDYNEVLAAANDK